MRPFRFSFCCRLGTGRRTKPISVGAAGGFDLRLRRRRLAALLRFSCLILLLAAVISGCGSSGEAGDENEPPEYAATPRKALESWVSAVRAGDGEMMCLLLSTRTCTLVEERLLPLVRAEMRGLKGDLHYGAIDIGAPEARIVIGIVSGDSPAAYAVPVARGRRQWSIDDEERSDPFRNPREPSFNNRIRRMLSQADARRSPSPPGHIALARTTRTQNCGSIVDTSMGAWT
jgi:hypothetical protein